ncbi:MAG: hypothetical protein H6581_17420 [Bacteroidia bacterium]|nr:hypothetical protein [Bacteroidia bacterium]
MDIKLDKTDDLNGLITVTVTPEDYKANLVEKLKDYAKKANLKGFRKGKVPISLIKKMVGPGLMLDELNKILIERLNAYIVDEKLNLIGNPLPKSALDMALDVDADQEIVFDYEVGFAPEIKLSYDVKVSPARYKVVMDDAQLDKEVRNLAERYGKMENPEESMSGDTLYGKLFAQPGQEDKVPDGFRFGSSPMVMLPLKPENLPADSPFKDMLAGKKADDVIEGIKLDEIIAEDADQKSYWRFAKTQHNYNPESTPEMVSDEELSVLKGLTFNFEVKKVNRIIPEELNADFFARIFPSEVIEDVDAFREKLRAEMEKYFDEDADRLVKNQIADAIMEVTPVNLPVEFLKKWLINSEEKVTKDNIEEEWAKFEKGLAWTLLTKQMRTENPELEVTDEDMRNQVISLVSQQFGAEIEGDRLNNIVDYYLKDEKMSEQVFRDLADKKIFDFVLTKVSPAEQEITATEYIKLGK